MLGAFFSFKVSQGATCICLDIHPPASDVTPMEQHWLMNILLEKNHRRGSKFPLHFKFYQHHPFSFISLHHTGIRMQFLLYISYVNHVQLVFILYLNCNFPCLTSVLPVSTCSQTLKPSCLRFSLNGMAFSSLSQALWLE